MRDAVFVARWYAYITRIYLANRQLRTARPVVADGLGPFRVAGYLYVARGMITERQAFANVPDVLAAMRERRLDEGLIPNTLAQAIVDYRRALSLDAEHAGARLRLTWIRLLQRDGRARELMPRPWFAPRPIRRHATWRPSSTAPSQSAIGLWPRPSTITKKRGVKTSIRKQRAWR